MSEQTTMTEENKKTIIAFIVGLLVGGLLVYVFAMPADGNKKEADNDAEMSEDADMDGDSSDEMMDDSDEDTSSMSDNDASSSTDASGGSITVNNQGAANMVVLESVSFPTTEGWVGVRDYENGQMTGLLGVARWNKESGLLPNTITLLRPTVAGRTYAVVFFSDNGDRQFSLANDVQMSGVMSTFTAR